MAKLYMKVALFVQHSPPHESSTIYSTLSSLARDVTYFKLQRDGDNITGQKLSEEHILK